MLADADFFSPILPQGFASAAAKDFCARARHRLDRMAMPPCRMPSRRVDLSVAKRPEGTPRAPLYVARGAGFLPRMPARLRLATPPIWPVGAGHPAAAPALELVQLSSTAGSPAHNLRPVRRLPTCDSLRRPYGEIRGRGEPDTHPGLDVASTSTQRQARAGLPRSGDPLSQGRRHLTRERANPIVARLARPAHPAAHPSGDVAGSPGARATAQLNAAVAPSARRGDPSRHRDRETWRSDLARMLEDRARLDARIIRTVPLAKFATVFRPRPWAIHPDWPGSRAARGGGVARILAGPAPGPVTDQWMTEGPAPDRAAEAMPASTR